MGVDLNRVPWNETGFYLENKKQLHKTSLLSGGLYYIEEAVPGKACECSLGERFWIYVRHREAKVKPSVFGHKKERTC